MHPSPRYPDTLRRTAGALALFVLAQAVSLQLLCLCGACPRSFALGVGAPAAGEAAHACCRQALAEAARQAALQPQVLGVDACCADAHDREAGQAVLGPDGSAAPTPPLAVVAALSLPAAAGARIAGTGVLPRPRSRAPPGVAPPPFLAHHAFLI